MSASLSVGAMGVAWYNDLVSDRLGACEMLFWRSLWNWESRKDVLKLES